MTFLIQFTSKTDPGILSVPMIAKDYESVAKLFYIYFDSNHYHIVDISIIDYEEW